MGGHGHGHGDPYKIPSPDIYKVEDIPQLKRVQERLAEKGLKDPWLRNEVWRFQLQGTRLSRAASLLLRGSKLGVPAFLLTIGVEYALGIEYGHGGHHGDHNDHGHH